MLSFEEGAGVYPVLALRDVVIFPHMVMPLFVGREKSVKALESALEGQKQVVLVAQQRPEQDDPSPQDLFKVGTLAQVLQLLRLPDGTIKVLVEGIKRIALETFVSTAPFLRVQGRTLEDSGQDKPNMPALCRSLFEHFESFTVQQKKIAPEVVQSLVGIENPSRLADTVAAHLPVRLADKQKVLEIQDVGERMETILALIATEIDLLEIDKRIRGRVKEQMEKNQREYYLNEQVKAIQKELGEEENELDELEARIASSGMPEEARKKAEGELKKLRLMPPMSAEVTVVRNYLDTLLSIPWKKRSRIHRDLAEAERILNEDHFGLEKVKERILEYLAVQSRARSVKGPILCLVGPPGVGKTSLGKSMASATHRKFARMALGGVRDEAEIRGHRRTYIGSMPGKIVSNLIKTGVKNPLFVFDEVDKMGKEFWGDPGAALLEVLDPEQNNAFVDHYLEVEVDLSEVLFVATANTLDIPAPLLDRMEVIRLPGYTPEEKFHIARRFLLPKAMRENGLKEKELSLSDEAIQAIIESYTREAGVRNLEREIQKICRKVVKELLLHPQMKSVAADDADIEKYLGVRRFTHEAAAEEDQVGRVSGLAWTEVGGELLTVEAVAMPGKGKSSATGKLGKVMQESVQAALSVVRSRAERLGIAPDFYEKFDIHVHLPEGATPKDGPSAGIAICTALVSVLAQVPVKASVAMTGEITLRGEVLAIGGLKEKLLAAARGGIKTVLIPQDNAKDLADIPDGVKNKLEIIPVRWIDEVFVQALSRLPEPMEGKEGIRVSNPPEKTLPLTVKH